MTENRKRGVTLIDMKTLIISYSLTGNNESLAAALAGELGAERAVITEAKKRTMTTSLLDAIFGRIPKVRMPEIDAADFEQIVFVAPVWAGMVASPLRACFRDFRNKIVNYSFVSLSGGAGGKESNPKLGEELEKRLGSKPKAVIDLHISDLLPKEPAPTPQITMAFRLEGKEAAKLAKEAAAQLR